MVFGGIPLLLLGIWLVRTFEPAGQPFYPRCQFHAVTGLQCPGCGSTRAVHHLLNGDVPGSLRSNALLLLLWGPLAVVLAWKAWRGQRLDRVVNGRSLVGLLVLLGLFFLLRNLPGPTRIWLNPPPPSMQ